MADIKPPRFDADERSTLMGLLAFQRSSILRKVDGLSDEDSRRRIVPSETTLHWLVGHVARAESAWVLIRFAGLEPLPIPDESAALAEVIESYCNVTESVDAVVADAVDLGERCADSQYRDTPLRWVLAHLLEETARHAGHADILRELIDGSTGR